MIDINIDNLEFHISTNESSYIMKVLPSGHLVNIHYGSKIKHRENLSHLYQDFNCDLGNGTNYSPQTESLNLNTLRLELSTSGKGDYRDPSIQMEFMDGSRVADFKYISHEIIKGDVKLHGLPYTHKTEDSDNLIITLHDEIKGVFAELKYSVFPEEDVITRSLELINNSSNNLIVNKAMSFNLDFSDSEFELITLEGKWIREGQINKRKINKGIFTIDSKKGVSGSNHNPSLCLKRNYTTEESGECYGFTLLYSGNHNCQVEVNPHDYTRVQMGISPFEFRWELKPDESFQTPEIIMTYSKSGLSKMSSNFHRVINGYLIPEKWRYKNRPILLNNWEATYFDFNEGKLLNLAKAAKEIGIELFVLDDGWFGSRNNDKTSLGDFFENVQKLPKGLAGFSQKLEKIGLDFGIWVEPEMISVESELYKKHPEWAVTLPDRDPSFGRNQLLLDLTNPEVIEYLYSSLKQVFISGNVKYVKWDMNRNISDTYSNYLDPHSQGEFNHRYILGLYSLLERLTTEFSHVLFESCSSGGNRFDAGMLHYMPQTWTSDNTDAVDRTLIQNGMSLFYPQSTMGAHVSGEPSHQVLRTTPIESRFNIAAFGVLGYEMDITKITEFERKAIIKQIEFYKENRELLQFGDLYRIKSPFENNISTWMVKNRENTSAIVGYYQKIQEANMGLEKIRIPVLDPDKEYVVSNRGQYINIRHFGNLVNDELPIDLKINGIIHTVVSNRYMLLQEIMEEKYFGDQLTEIGLLLQNQFIGTGMTPKTRFIGDFGSRLYTIHLA